MVHALVPARRSGQHEHVGGLAFVHLRHLLRDDDERVGLAERGHLMRPLAGERGDLAAGAVQQAAQERPPARR